MTDVIDILSEESDHGAGCSEDFLGAQDRSEVWISDDEGDGSAHVDEHHARADDPLEALLVAIPAPSAAAAPARKEKPKRRFAAPRKRSKVEHELLMAKCRAAKAEKGRHKDRARFRDALVKKRRALKASTKMNPRQVDRALVKLRDWEPKQNRKQVAVERDVEVALDTSYLRCRDLERAHLKDRKGIRRSQAVVAQSFIKKQEQLLERWIKRASKGGLLAVHGFVAFDGNRVRARVEIVIDGIDTSKMDSCTYGWEAIVPIRIVILVFQGCTVALPLGCVIVPSSGSNAEAVFNAVFEIGANQRLEEYVRRLCSLAPLSTTTFGMDGHYGNERLCAAYSQGLIKGHYAMKSEPCTKVICFSHKTHKLEELMKTIATENAVDGIFSLSAWLRMGSNFSRVLGVVRNVIARRLVIVRKKMPEACHNFAREVMSWAVQNKNMFKSATKKRQPRRGQGKRQKRQRKRHTDYVKDWEDLLTVWKGNFEQAGDILIYNEKLDREELITRMTNSYVKLALSSLITQPEHGKWTKLLPATEWAVIADSICRMLSSILVEAGKEMKIVVQKPADAEAGRELSYSELSGKRYTSGRDVQVSLDKNFHVRMLCVIMEPVKPVVCHFLRASTANREVCSSPVLDLYNPSFSPVTQGRQHLRWLGSGCSPRLQILSNTFGYACIADMLASEDHKDLAVKALVAARVVSAAARGRMALHTFPLCAVEVLDKRLPYAQRLRRATQIVGLPSCCVGTFWADFFDKLPARPSPEELLEGDWQSILGGWSEGLQHVLSIAGIERRNRRSRPIAGGCSVAIKWQSFVSMSLVREFTSLHEIAEALDVQRGENLIRAGIVAPAEKCAARKPKRALGALEAYIVDESKKLALDGEQMNIAPFSEGFKRRMKEQFDQETLETRDYYNLVSEEQKIQAKQKRAAFKERARPQAPAALAIADGSSVSGALVSLEEAAGHIVKLEEVECAQCGQQMCYHSQVTAFNGMHGFRDVAPTPAVGEECAADDPCTQVVLRCAEELPPEDAMVGAISVQVHEEMLKNYHSRVHAEEVFMKEQAIVAVNAEVFPKRIKVEVPCVGFCNNSQIQVKLMAAKMLQWFATLAKSLGKPSTVGFEAMFLEMHLFVEDVEKAQLVVSLDWAQARSGPHAPVQYFTMCNLVDASLALGADEKLLVFQVEEFVPAETVQVRQPKREGRQRREGAPVGAYKQISEREVVGRILDPLLRLDPSDLARLQSAHVDIVAKKARPVLWSEDLLTAGLIDERRHDLWSLRTSEGGTSTRINLFGEASDGDFLDSAIAAQGVLSDEDRQLLEEWLGELALSSATESESSNYDSDNEVVDSSDQDSVKSQDEAPLDGDVAPASAVFEECGLYEIDGDCYRVENDMHVGTMSMTIMGVPYVRAFCQRHPRCIIYMSSETKFREKWNACIQWIAVAHLQSAAEHEDSASALKVSFGIRPRRRAPASVPTATAEAIEDEEMSASVVAAVAAEPDAT